MGSRMAKHRIRKTWKSITAQSRLSVPQVSATALAAITMAVVSSRLTSFSSSILIVGLISVVSALASEFYRILITSSAEKTKQVVAPILPVLAGEERSQGAEATADGTETAVHTDLTTTQPTLDDTVVEDGVKLDDIRYRDLMFLEAEKLSTLKYSNPLSLLQESGPSPPATRRGHHVRPALVSFSFFVGSGSNPV